MLWKKLQQAKKNLGLEEKLITSPENEHRIVEKEEVIIGQDYYEDNMWYVLFIPIYNLFSYLQLNL